MKKESIGFNESFLFGILSRLIFSSGLFALIWYLIIPNSSINYRKDYQPFSSRLNNRDIVMVQGEVFKLRLLRLNKRVKYSSMDIKVAIVSPFGNIIALRPGKTFIKLTYDDKEIKCRVRVYKLNKTNISIGVDEKYDLDLIGPGIIKSVKWYSNKSRVAKVNRFGTVKGVSRGDAIITAKIHGKEIKCKVIVR